jgi:hypothetical protein
MGRALDRLRGWPGRLAGRPAGSAVAAASGWDRRGFHAPQQGDGQLAARGEPLAGVFLQRPGQRLRLLQADQRIEQVDRCGGHAGVLHDEALRGIRLEGQATRQRLVYHHRQRVLIGLVVDVTGTDGDFGGEVRRGADQPAGSRQLHARLAGVDELGQAEIAQVRSAHSIEQNVGRLYVAVDVALRVHEVQGRGNIRQPVAEIARVVQPPHGLKPVVQRATGQIRQHDIGHLPLLAHIHNRHDVGVTQVFERAHFALEALGKVSPL